MKDFTRENLPRRSRQIFDRILEAKRERDLTILTRNGWGVTVGDLGTQHIREGFSTIKGGPVCAVGAGCLWRPSLARGQSALEGFCAAHGVSLAFAAGVSDGFEQYGPGVRALDGADVRKSIRGYTGLEEVAAGKNDRRDYLAGVRLGLTVYEELARK